MRDSYTYRERKGAAGAPLLFLFHGTGGDEDQLIDVAGEVLPGAHVIAPRGDVSEHGALRFFRRTGEGVYDMADLAKRTEAVAAFVAAHREAVKAPRVYGLGYSNGANILANLLVTQPALFDGVVLLHPLMPFTPAPQPGLAGKPVLITAGRRDPIGPAPVTEAFAGWLRGQGADVRLVWHEGGHEFRPSEIAAARSFLSPAAAHATAG